MMEEEDEEILHSPPNDGVIVALPVESTPPPLQIVPAIQKQSGGGRDDCWSEIATGILIEAWGERYLELRRGNFKQKHWQEVAQIVNSSEDYGKTPKTDVQCKNRIDTVKKKYKLEKSRILTGGGGGVSNWVFFKKLDYLIGPMGKISQIPIGIPVRATDSVNRSAANANKMGYINRALPAAGEMESDEQSEDSTPPPQPAKKRRWSGIERQGEVRGKEKSRKNEGTRELARAISRLGEAYEKMESAKLTQAVNMERKRLKMVRDLELQTIQLFAEIQSEIYQVNDKGTRKGGN